MTATQIKKELLRWNEGRPFISVSELAHALKIGRDSARSIVAGLSYLKNGNRKDYLVESVAERLAERSTY